MEPEDEGYDPAPAPPHERVWRHPSEVGEVAWRRSEPPLTIGRGLLFTTGAIGGLLALAVLWTTLPTGAGSSVAAVSTQAARTVRVAQTAVSSLAALDTPSTDTVRSAVVRPAAGAAPASSTISTAPGPADTLTPSEPASPSESTSTDGPGTAPPTTLHLSGVTSPGRSAVAVLIGSTQVVLTTAGAIDPDDTVTLTDGDGATRHATVMLIYRGVAVLETDGDIGTPALALGTPIHAGDTVTVVGSSAVSLALGLRDDGGMKVDEWGDADAPEGAPVINGHGQLVGLCRRGRSGPELVTVDARALRNMIAAATGTNPATPGPSTVPPTLTVATSTALTTSTTTAPGSTGVPTSSTVPSPATSSSIPNSTAAAASSASGAATGATP